MQTKLQIRMQAARKAQRVRKQMLAARGLVHDESVPIIEDVYVMPAWIQRALPCPNYSDKPGGRGRQKV